MADRNGRKLDRIERGYFLTAMYLRLSREDGARGMAGMGSSPPTESNSIGNQRELLRTFIDGQTDMELYDIYIDDGFSGSNYDRPEFRRMMKDIEAGKVNCIVVKDLSRFGRDYIETGRYIQKIFPALSVRFIALTDGYDSFRADAGESGIILPIKNFINDSYCRDISIKVKSQFEVKRKNGECIAPFAPYGYRKSRDDKNRLAVDGYAAEVVRKIFAWKIEGLAVSSIAEKLTGLGVLSPGEYKKYAGTKYRSGFAGASRSRWSSAAVKRILTNEIYLGHLLQGKTEKISYKLKKIVEKPREEWIKAENTHEAIIMENDFRIVENLLKTDGRVSPSSGETGFFAGLLFCGDCGEQMIKRVNRYKDTEKIYYICSSKNRGEGCSRHSVAEEELRGLVAETVRSYADLLLDAGRISQRAAEMKADFSAIAYCDEERKRLKREEDRYRSLCEGLHEDVRQEIVAEQEAVRLQEVFGKRADELAEAQKRQENMKKEMIRKGFAFARRLKAMQASPGLEEIDRYTLCNMVKRIAVFEGKRIEIEFNYRFF